MKKEVISIMYDGEGGKQALFICPGCGNVHAPRIEGKGAVWGFNGDLVKPTFKSSILVNYPSYSLEKRNIDVNKFKDINDRYPTLEEMPYDMSNICHSFITDGKIKFLEDCTHNLKNKTVKLKPI